MISSKRDDGVGDAAVVIGVARAEEWRSVTQSSTRAKPTGAARRRVEIRLITIGELTPGRGFAIGDEGGDLLA